MNTKRLLQPIDKLAIALIMFLALIMGLLVWGGSACGTNCIFHAGAKVSDFSWQHKTIGKEDRAFVLTFNRPMNRASVEQNLAIFPPLPGKISWSGLRLAYTLKTPAPYGETYQISLTEARDRFANREQQGDLIQPFQGEFRSRDRAFAYIGTQGVEKGRLILLNWTQQQKSILTPKNLTVFAVAVAQGEGIALLPLETKAEPIDFLPKFGQVLDFTADGTGAAMIDYNTDNAKLRYTRSLVYVNNQGIQKQLLNTEGSIQDCQFDPTATHLYCWLTELEKGEEYIEQPCLAKINLKTLKTTTLVALSKYQDSKVSVAPDGLGILFERYLNNAHATVTEPSTTINSSLWLLIPPADNSSNSVAPYAEQLPFFGLHPQWLS